MLNLNPKVVSAIALTNELIPRYQSATVAPEFALADFAIDQAEGSCVARVTVTGVLLELVGIDVGFGFDARPVCGSARRFRHPRLHLDPQRGSIETIIQSLTDKTFAEEYPRIISPGYCVWPFEEGVESYFLAHPELDFDLDRIRAIVKKHAAQYDLPGHA